MGSDEGRAFYAEGTTGVKALKSTLAREEFILKFRKELYKW